MVHEAAVDGHPVMRRRDLADEVVERLDADVIGLELEDAGRLARDEAAPPRRAWRHTDRALPGQTWPPTWCRRPRPAPCPTRSFPRAPTRRYHSDREPWAAQDRCSREDGCAPRCRGTR